MDGDFDLVSRTVFKQLCRSYVLPGLALFKTYSIINLLYLTSKIFLYLPSVKFTRHVHVSTKIVITSFTC